MLRVFTIVPIVAIGLAMPAVAQHVSDQDARQSAESWSRRLTRRPSEGRRWTGRPLLRGCYLHHA
jgi:hypothetical protein